MSEFDFEKNMNNTNGAENTTSTPFSNPYSREPVSAPAVQPIMQPADVQQNIQSADRQPVMQPTPVQHMQQSAPAQQVQHTAPVMNTQPAQQTFVQNTQPTQQQTAPRTVFTPSEAFTPAPVSAPKFTDPYAAAKTPSYAPSDFQPKQSKKSGKRWALSVAAICAALVISGGSFYAGVAYNTSTTAGTTTAAAASSQVAQANTVNVSEDGVEISSTITEVVEQAMPSMVAINTITESTMSVNPFFYYMFGDDYNQTYETSASGSGIIIAQNDAELMIVTNNHVVEGANTISVQFIDGESYDATVKGTSAANDLAVISVNISDIKADTLSKIKVATLGSSENLKLGEPAIAIGNSLGYGQSVTVGYISATEREVQISDHTMTLLQTDAAINPGNSGGALLNIKGEVIGINSAKYSDTSVEGTGYAIPISDAEPIINDLMNDTYVSDADKPYLGIYGQDVPASYQEKFNWPEGVYVSQVSDGSPATLAGLRAGDIITSINGTATPSMEELQKVIDGCKVGDQVTIEVSRTSQNGSLKQGTFTATLISRGDANVDD